MGRRLDLQNILESLLPDGKKYVYFQPPGSTIMQYPCITYHRDAANTKFANDKPYGQVRRYQVTIIDADPDSEIPAKVGFLARTSFQRFFVSDKLNHDIYTIYF